MGTNCAPLLANPFVHFYEDDLIQMKEHRLARSFDFRFRYKDDVLSLNNPSVRDFIHRIDPKVLEIKDTTDIVKSASYLNLYIEIDNKEKLLIKLYDKRDDFSFRTVNSSVRPELAVTVFVPRETIRLMEKKMHIKYLEIDIT